MSSPSPRSSLATSASIPSPTKRPFPAARAAGAKAAKTPAPIIEPSPIATASTVPRRRASRLGAVASALTSTPSVHDARVDRPGTATDNEKKSGTQDHGEARTDFVSHLPEALLDQDGHLRRRDRDGHVHDERDNDEPRREAHRDQGAAHDLHD